MEESQPRERSHQGSAPSLLPKTMNVTHQGIVPSLLPIIKVVTDKMETEKGEKNK